MDVINNLWSKYPGFYVKAMFDVITKDGIKILGVRPNAGMFEDCEEENIKFIRFHKHDYSYYDEKRPKEYIDIRNKQQK